MLVCVRPLHFETTMRLLLTVLAMEVLRWWGVLQPLVLQPLLFLPLMLVRIRRVGRPSAPYKPVVKLLMVPAERPLRGVQWLPAIATRRRRGRVAIPHPRRVLLPVRRRRFIRAGALQR